MIGIHFRSIRPDGTTLHLAPLTNRLIQAVGDDIREHAGHYLYEESADDPNDIRILAHVPIDEAVFELSQMLNLKAMS